MPPEAPLLFEVTLLEVRDGPDPQRLPPAARLRLGSKMVSPSQSRKTASGLKLVGV